MTFKNKHQRYRRYHISRHTRYSTNLRTFRYRRQFILVTQDIQRTWLPGVREQKEKEKEKIESQSGAAVSYRTLKKNPQSETAKHSILLIETQPLSLKTPYFGLHMGPYTKQTTRDSSDSFFLLFFFEKVSELDVCSGDFLSGGVGGVNKNVKYAPVRRVQTCSTSCARGKTCALSSAPSTPSPLSSFSPAPENKQIYMQYRNS